MAVISGPKSVELRSSYKTTQGNLTQSPMPGREGIAGGRQSPNLSLLGVRLLEKKEGKRPSQISQ